LTGPRRPTIDEQEHPDKQNQQLPLYLGIFFAFWHCNPFFSSSFELLIQHRLIAGKMDARSLSSRFRELVTVSLSPALRRQAAIPRCNPACRVRHRRRATPDNDGPQLLTAFTRAQFLSSVQGDLSNVTAPPSFLAPSSVVEVGHCWAQRPAVFAAPAREAAPDRRALAVLKLVLVALRSQLYVAGAPGVSIKKPLNAFLGELFLARWHDAAARASTSLVAEQVSHHPPITAMAIADEENGVRADGYARVEMTFNGNVNIRQVGHAILRVEEYEEDYLIPLPDVKVRGFLAGKLYPEVVGKYSIQGSNGYVAEIEFSGEGYVTGKRNSFQARLFRQADKDRSLYTVSGCWSEGWTVKNAKGVVIEEYDVDAEANQPRPIDIAPVEHQDPWESRRAWGGVLDGIRTGNCMQTVTEKKKIEQAQRAMRRQEEERGDEWEPLFFESLEGCRHMAFHKLAKDTSWKLNDDKTKGVWKIKEGCVQATKRPYRGELTPTA
jgi:oxysterol-binding protein-related protein 9/10/11